MQMTVEKLLASLVGVDPKAKVWVGLNDGPIVPVEEGADTLDPDGKPAFILFQEEE